MAGKIKHVAIHSEDGIDIQGYYSYNTLDDFNRVEEEIKRLEKSNHKKYYAKETSIQMGEEPFGERSLPFVLKLEQLTSNIPTDRETSYQINGSRVIFREGGQSLSFYLYHTPFNEHYALYPSFNARTYVKGESKYISLFELSAEAKDNMHLRTDYLREILPLVTPEQEKNFHEFFKFTQKANVIMRNNREVPFNVGNFCGVSEYDGWSGNIGVYDITTRTEKLTVGLSSGDVIFSAYETNSEKPTKEEEAVMQSLADAIDLDSYRIMTRNAIYDVDFQSDLGSMGGFLDYPSSPQFEEEDEEIESPAL